MQEETMNLEKIIRPEILSLQNYFSNSLDCKKKNAYTYLDSNLNPYEPYSHSTNVAGCNRYIDQQPKDLLSTLSQLYKICNDSILLTHGSDEGIDIIIKTFCKAYEDSIIICPPTFSMYKIFAQIQAANVIEVPLNAQQGYQLNVEKILASITPKTKLIFIPNPNAPMGHLISSDDIIKICNSCCDTTMVVVDEAYIEFSSTKSFVNLDSKPENLICLRTLSKAYSMAGLRLGSIIAHPELINVFRKVLAPYPHTVPGVNIALEALSSEGQLRANKNIAEIIAQRNFLAGELSKLVNVTKIFPSQANYLLCQFTNIENALNACKRAKFIIRDMSSQIERCLRISIGTPTDNLKILNALKASY